MTEPTPASRSGPTRPDPSVSPAQTVGRAIQRMAAARLGRGFVPLALLFFAGVGEMLSGSGGLALALGALLSAGAMLAYALRIVQRAFGRSAAPWMSLAGAAGVIPLAYGLWVLGWLGLRGVAAAGGLVASVWAVLLSVLGVWVLRAWLKIQELHALAEAMALGLPGDGDGQGSS